MPSTSILTGLSQEETDLLLPYLSHRDLTLLSLTTPQNYGFFTQDNPDYRTRILTRLSSWGISKEKLEIFEHYCAQKAIRINYTDLYRNLIQFTENLNYVSPELRQQIKNKENRLLILFCCANNEKLAQFLPIDSKLILQIALLAGSGDFIQQAITAHHLTRDTSVVLHATMYNPLVVKKLLLGSQNSIDGKTLLRTTLQLQDQLDEKALKFIGHLIGKMGIDWRKATENLNNSSPPRSAMYVFITEGNLLLARFIMELYKKNNLQNNEHATLIQFCACDSRSFAKTRLLAIDYPPKTRNMLQHRELLQMGLQSQATSMMDYLLSYPEQAFPNSHPTPDLEEIKEILSRNTCLGTYGGAYNI